MCCRCGDVRWRLEVVLYALEMPEVMYSVLVCMLEVVDGELCLLAVLEVMRCMLLRILEAVEGCWRYRR